MTDQSPIKDQTDAVLAYWSEHRQQLRQSEDQRAVLTNYVLVIASALTGLIAQQKLARETLPVAILIMILGIYGAITVAKYHERAEYHLTQARALTKTLTDLGALPGDTTLLRRVPPTSLRQVSKAASYPPAPAVDRAA